MGRWWWCGASIAALASVPSAVAAPLDPRAVEADEGGTLGDQVFPPDAITIDTSLFTIVGASSIPLDGFEVDGVAVFLFDSLDVPNGATLTVTGNHALALLTTGDLNMDGTLTARAIADQPGPGGFWGGSDESSSAGGDGAGASAADFGGGGGLGGRGGDGSSNAQGGADAFGCDLFTFFKGGPAVAAPAVAGPARWRPPAAAAAEPSSWSQVARSPLAAPWT